MIEFKALHSEYSQEMAGYIPFYFNEVDPRDTLEQLREGYELSSGFPPLEYFNKEPRKHKFFSFDGSLKYPGDPSQFPIAEATFRDDKIYQYEHEIFAVLRADG